MKEYLKFVLHELSRLNTWTIYGWLFAFWLIVAIILCVVFQTLLFIGLFIVLSAFIALGLIALEDVFIPAFDKYQRAKNRKL